MAKSPFSQALSDLADSIKRYLQLRLNIIKLEVMEKTARVVSLTIAAVFLLLVFVLFLLFVSLAAAGLAGDLLNSQALGYLCVAGFYLLLLILLFVFRRRLFLGAVIKHMSEIFFEDKSGNNDEAA